MYFYIDQNNNHNYKGPRYSFEAYVKNKEDKRQAEIAEKELAEFVGYKPTDNQQAETGKKRNTKDTTVCQVCNIF